MSLSSAAVAHVRLERMAILALIFCILGLVQSFWSNLIYQISQRGHIGKTLAHSTVDNLLPIVFISPCSARLGAIRIWFGQVDKAARFFWVQSVGDILHILEMIQVRA